LWFLLNVTEPYPALENDEIDLARQTLSAEELGYANSNSDIEVNTSDDLGYYIFDLNHQRWPTSDLHFRRALAHLVDKDGIVSNILQGFGYRLDTPMPSILSSWINPDVTVYDYDAALATVELELGGFVDTDSDGIRNDPQSGENMEPLIIYIRQDDSYRKLAGEWLVDELEALGVPVYAPVVDRSFISEKVFNEQVGNWSVYTAGWGTFEFPYHLADLYHSEAFDPDCLSGWRGYNYPGFVNDTYDYWADIQKNASSYEEVLEATFNLQDIFALEVTGIPLYGLSGYRAYRTEWTGTVNEVGAGVTGWWSLYNMHQENQDEGGIIRYGFVSELETLNPLTASWAWTWEVLEKIYEYPIASNPHDPNEYWPWLAESWEIEGWTSPSGEDSLNVTFHFVENATWHDGVDFTADDVMFTYEYLREQDVERYEATAALIAGLTLVNEYTLEVYLNTSSYFALGYLNEIPILPRHIWESVGDGWNGYDPVAEDTLIGLGPWKFVENVSGEYVRLVDNYEYFKYPEARAVEEWNVSLSVDVGGYTSTTVYGMRHEATGGFDADAGDELVPPAPTMGVSSYFYYPDNPVEQYIDYRKLSTSYYPIEYPAQWTLYAKTISVSGEAVLTWASWDIYRIPGDYFVSLETPTGSVNMREATSYTWTAEADTTYIFNVTLTSEVEHTLNLVAGWNMVSLPVMPEDVSAASVLSDVGFYQLVTWSGSGYVSATSFEEGRGYWLLVLQDTNVTVKGAPVHGVLLTLPPGWSMVGGPNSEVAASEVFPGFYQLVTWSGSGYVSATSFEPGKGYWALVLQETEINIGSPVASVIQIGVTSAATSGLESTNAVAQLAEAAINEYADEQGLDITFEFIIEDNQGTAAIALENTQDFHEMGVDLIVGHGWSSQCHASLSYADENNMVLLSHSSTSPILALPDDSLFRACPNDLVQAPALAEMWSTWGAQAVFTIHRGDTWGDGLWNLLETEFEEKGIVNLGRIRYSTEATEFSSYLDTANDTIADAIDTYGWERVGIQFFSFDELNTIQEQASDYPSLMDVIWMSTESGGRSESRLSAVGEYASITRHFSPLMGVAEDSSDYVEFAASYEELMGFQPSFYSATQYDAMWLMALAIVETGGTNPTEIKQALIPLSSEYYGVSGWLDLDENGDRLPQMFDIWGFYDASGSGDYSYRKWGEYNGTSGQITWDDEALLNYAGLTRPALTP